MARDHWVFVLKERQYRPDRLQERSRHDEPQPVSCRPALIEQRPPERRICIPVGSSNFRSLFFGEDDGIRGDVMPLSPPAPIQAIEMRWREHAFA